MKKVFIDIIGGIIIILALIYIWFHSGYVIASGESGLFFHTIENVINFYGQTWFGGAIGFPGNGLPLIDLPLFNSIYILRLIHIPYVVIQATFYFFLQLVGFVSVYFISYLLNTSLTFNKRRAISILAALFYIFNQINIVIILNRMQYPFLFSYALLPLGLLVFILATQKKQLRFAFIIPLITAALATSFSEISSVLLFWIVLVSFAAFHFFFFERNKKYLLFSTKVFLISVVGWLLVSFWWILPMFKTLGGSPYVTKLTYNPNADLNTFLALSKVLGNLSYIFRLMHHDFYIWMKDVWGGYYQTPIVILLTFLPPVLVFGSLLVKKKFSHYYFFIFMSILSVFFMKGAAEPFGAVFQFIFSHIRVLEAFRNSFEKISVALPLFYALPFAWGAVGIYEFVKKRLPVFAANLTILTICFISFVVIVLPLWNGWVFTGSTIPSSNKEIGFKVQVPDYYAQADSWLNKSSDDFRVIVLPIGEEIITYNWKYGYNGVELSNGIFSKPFISYCTTIQFLCEITHDIEPTLLQYPNDFWKILDPLDAKYIMLRKDTNYKVDQMQNPGDLQKKIESADNIKLQKVFGPLTFYDSNTTNNSKIFAATQGIFIDGENSFIDAVPVADYKKNDLYFTEGNLQTNLLNTSHQIILQGNEFVPPQLKISKENALLELPYVRFLPGSPFYVWTRLRENFDNFLAGNNDLSNKVVESDKRLVESYNLLQLGKTKAAGNTMTEYLSLLQNFYQSNVLFDEDKEKEDLLRQKYVLEDTLSLAGKYNDKNDIYKKASNILGLILRNNGLEPLIPSDLTTDRVYIVTVPMDGNYTIKISKRDYDAYYPMGVIKGIVDGKNSFSTDTNTSDKFLTLGTFNFSKGQHQINIPIARYKNLLPVDKLTINTKNNSSHITSNIYALTVNDLNPFGRYKLSFDYEVTAGNPFQIIFIQDSELAFINKNGIHYNPVQYTGHMNSWYHFEATIVPRSNSRSGKLEFYIYPGNVCKKNNVDSQKCEDKSFSERYNTASTAEIKNLSFTRQDIGNIFLTKDQLVQNTYRDPKVSFTKENSARYIIKISGASTSFFLTFLEAYHPLWKLYYMDGNKKTLVNEENHIFVNSYANAWLVDKKGDYNMLLEFAPQSFFEIGRRISIITFSTILIGLIAYLVKKKIKKS